MDWEVELRMIEADLLAGEDNGDVDQIASYFRGKSDEGNIYQIPYKKLKIDRGNLDVLLLDTEAPNDKWLRFKLKSTSKYPPIDIDSSNLSQPIRIYLADTYHVMKVTKIN